jgi:tetratricopeptide (TPR) repeat protein
MTGNAQRWIRRLIGSAIAIVLLCGAPIFAQEEKISPLSDYMYKKDFARYEEIKKEANVQKRADLLTNFVKERPISRMLLYVTSNYLECLKPYIDKQDWARIISAEESFLALLPSEKSVRSQSKYIPVGLEEFLKEQLAASKLLIQRGLLTAYYQSNNLPKAAETAEKVYAATSDKTMLPALADIFLKMQNHDKYLVYGQKLMDATPINQERGYRTALQMADIYIKKQQTNKAIDLLSKVMSVYADRVPPGFQEASWNATRAFYYGVVAARAYEAKDYNKALDLYGRVVRFDSKRDDAYYFMGMAKWQTGDQAGAIPYLARCAVLGKNYSEKARQYLEQLYRAEHSDSLDGLDQELENAKSSLGIR